MNTILFPLNSCHFPKSMHFYLPETWLCTDVDDLRTAIFGKFPLSTQFVLPTAVKFVNRKSSLARDLSQSLLIISGLNVT